MVQMQDIIDLNNGLSQENGEEVKKQEIIDHEMIDNDDDQFERQMQTVNIDSKSGLVQMQDQMDDNEDMEYKGTNHLFSNEDQFDRVNTLQ